MCKKRRGCRRSRRATLIAAGSLPVGGGPLNHELFFVFLCANQRGTPFHIGRADRINSPSNLNCESIRATEQNRTPDSCSALPGLSRFSTFRVSERFVARCFAQLSHPDVAHASRRLACRAGVTRKWVVNFPTCCVVSCCAVFFQWLRPAGPRAKIAWAGARPEAGGGLGELWPSEANTGLPFSYGIERWMRFGVASAQRRCVPTRVCSAKKNSVGLCLTCQTDSPA